MAQYRRTTNSLGGPTRIADPGADELARMVALQLQRQGQADQAAQAQARMSLEERLAMEAGRRDDARLAADVARNQQQAALAERGFGLDERRFANESARGGRADELALRMAGMQERQGDERIDLEREDFGLRRKAQGFQQGFQRQEADAGQKRFELEQALRRELQKDQLGASASESAADRANRLGIAGLEYGRDAQRRMEDRQQRSTERAEDFAREDRGLEQAVGMREREKVEAQGREAQTAGVQALDGLAFGDVIPDDPNTETEGPARGKIAALSGYLPGAHGMGPAGVGTGVGFGVLADAAFGAQDPTQDLRPIVARIDAAMARSGATTEKDVLKAAAVVRNKLQTDFERAFQQQGSEFGIDNAQEQARLYLMALEALDRVQAEHMARVSGGPGPSAPPANRYFRPAKQQ
jgi:hypothetical protein